VGGRQRFVAFLATKRRFAAELGHHQKNCEVDDVLQARPELRERIVEVHPEVSFAEWAGEPLLASKKSRDGAALRRALLEQQFPGAFEKIRAAHSRKSDVGDDDIADALAALWTAQRIAYGTERSLQPEPPLDETGLPMRIVC
jgi:predicted RNase H-like nuclease